jgi:hypothetical protein
MIWGIDYAIWALIVYGVVAVFGSGITYELWDDPDDEDIGNIIFGFVMWPFAAVLLAGIVIFLGVSIFARSPGKLIKYLIKVCSTTDLPSAKVVKE